MEVETPQKERIQMSSFNISFADISNLESLVNEADDVLSKKGLAMEHFVEMKRIIKKVKSNKS